MPSIRLPHTWNTSEASLPPSVSSKCVPIMISKFDLAEPNRALKQRQQQQQLNNNFQRITRHWPGLSEWEAFPKSLSFLLLRHSLVFNFKEKNWSPLIWSPKYSVEWSPAFRVFPQIASIFRHFTLG